VYEPLRKRKKKKHRDTGRLLLRWTDSQKEKGTKGSVFLGERGAEGKGFSFSATVRFSRRKGVKGNLRKKTT